MNVLCSIAPHCSHFLRTLKLRKALPSRNFEPKFVKVRCRSSEVSLECEPLKNVALEHVEQEECIRRWVDGIPEHDRKLFAEVGKRRMEVQERRANMYKKKPKFSPESTLRFNLDNCSKYADVVGALTAFEDYRGTVRFDQYNYNILLYLCSTAALGVLAPMKRRCDADGDGGNAGVSVQRAEKVDGNAGVSVQRAGENHSGASVERDARIGLSVQGAEAIHEDDRENGIEKNGVFLRGVMADLVGANPMGLSSEMMELCLQRGLDVFGKMLSDNVEPNEASLTALARFAVARSDGDAAFEIVQRMSEANIPPKLRSYGPALYVFFIKNDPVKAFEVYEHMLEHDVQPEEAELEVLLELGARAGWEDRVYEILHRLRETVRDVSKSTVTVIERWFRSGDHANRIVGEHLGNAEEVKEAMVARGGGWHGLGWLGSGRWGTTYTQMDKAGVCGCCNEKLVTIDLDPQETEQFATRVSGLAAKREQGTSFEQFKRWLDQHGPYEWIIDGANVGMFNQGQFNFAQLDAVVSEIQRRTGKWPLVVLHHNRVTTGPAKTFQGKKLLKHWSDEHALYTSPIGSNDDWYWIFAAVRSKAFLVTNDEMRDHIFQLLGRSFFPKWKERHQVHFRVRDSRGLQFFLPPPYSIVIQESPSGRWHIPVSEGDDISSPRKWLCVTRNPAEQ